MLAFDPAALIVLIDLILQNREQVSSALSSPDQRREVVVSAPEAAVVYAVG